jgi:valyl-tRNA synthetase
MAPITPHITEEIYSIYFKDKEKEKSIHLCSWPKETKVTADEEAGDVIIAVLSEIRKFKAKGQMSMKAELNRITIEYKNSEKLNPFIEDLKATTHAKEISFGKGDIEINENLKIKIEKP